MCVKIGTHIRGVNLIMKTENKLSYPLFSNLIISFLYLNFLIFNNSRQLVSINLDSNNLKPIYEMVTNEESVVENMTITVSQKEVMSQNTYKNYYVKPSYNSVTGMNLVNYAKNYVGLPYVPAGSSLSTGTDCSGFTRLIYMEFGIQLGRTVNSQLYSGSYVSKEDLQPGDLVFYGYYQGYSSHVAIYIGDGLIIHESNPRDGVKISSVNIMVYQTARRLITSNVTVTKPLEETKTEDKNEEDIKDIQEVSSDINNDNNTELENKEETITEFDKKIENDKKQIENKQDQDNLMETPDKTKEVEDNKKDLSKADESIENIQDENKKQTENTCQKENIQLEENLEN